MHLLDDVSLWMIFRDGSGAWPAVAAKAGRVPTSAIKNRRALSSLSKGTTVDAKRDAHRATVLNRVRSISKSAGLTRW